MMESSQCLTGGKREKNRLHGFRCGERAEGRSITDKRGDKRLVVHSSGGLTRNGEGEWRRTETSYLVRRPPPPPKKGIKGIASRFRGGVREKHEHKSLRNAGARDLIKVEKDTMRSLWGKKKVELKKKKKETRARG